MIRQATAVTSAPGGGEAERVRKAMATRPGLNANQNRSKVRSAPQDLSGATDAGTIQGRNGGTQQLGMAARRRLAAAPPSPGRGVVPPGAIGGDPTSDAVRSTTAGGMQVNSIAMPDEMTGRQPTPLQGEQLAQAMQRRGMPFGGSDPAGGRGFVPPGASGFEGPGGMSPDPNDPRTQELVSRMTGADPRGLEGPGMGGQDPAGGRGFVPPDQQGMGQGLPPQIMQRLQALRGGGMQRGAPGQAPPMAPGTGGPMGGGPQRSFQDFWQGGAGGGRGMAY